MASEEHDNDITAIIDDKVVKVTHVASDRNSYKDIKGIEYLGYGYYHTIEGRRSTMADKHHFWVLKPSKKHYETDVQIDLETNVVDLRLVKIKSCKLATYWYHNKIGKTFFVGETTNYGEVCYSVYTLFRDLESGEKDIASNLYKSGFTIQVEDCEILVG